MRLALVVALLTLTACSGRPMRRPEGIPPKAAWIGKGKQGRFVEIGARSGVFWTIFLFDAKGSRHSVNRWRLQGFARTSLDPEEIAGFEDGILILKDGARLVPEP